VLESACDLASTRRAITTGMRKSRRPVQELAPHELVRVVGGGADIGGILQAASPLLGMIPGFGSIAQTALPMIGNLINAAKSNGGQQQAQPDPAQAQAQAAAAQDSSGAVAQAAAIQAGGGGGGGGGYMPRRHHTSVSVSIN
jgi:hypothetical protein